MNSKCALTVIALTCVFLETILASSIIEEKSEVEYKDIGFSKIEIDKILQIVRDFHQNAKIIGFQKFLSAFTECFASASDPYSPYEHGIQVVPVPVPSKPNSSPPHRPHHSNRPPSPPHRPGNGWSHNQRPHRPNNNGWSNGWPNSEGNGWSNGWPNSEGNGWSDTEYDHGYGWNWSGEEYYDEDHMFNAEYNSDFGWGDNNGWGDNPELGFAGWSDMNLYENHGGGWKYETESNAEPSKFPVNANYFNGARHRGRGNLHPRNSKCIPVGVKCSFPSEENQFQRKVGNQKSGKCCNEDRCENKTCCIPTPSGRQHSPCSSDSQCCNNGLCNLATKMCYLRSGENCTHSKACANTLCTENKCCNPAKGTFPCQDSGDCCSGLCSNGFCKALSGQNCEADFQCVSNKCNDGVC